MGSTGTSRRRIRWTLRPVDLPDGRVSYRLLILDGHAARARAVSTDPGGDAAKAPPRTAAQRQKAARERRRAERDALIAALVWAAENLGPRKRARLCAHWPFLRRYLTGL